MYMSAVLKEKENPKINPFGRKNTGGAASVDVSGGSTAILEWIRQHGKEPREAIGLQAFQISWDGDSCLYNAGKPWWR